MNDTNEEIVDRALHHLRDTAPPDGMERRILSALRHRASAISVPSRSPWRLIPLAGGTVLASVVCVFIFTAHHKPPQASVPRPQAVSIPAVNGPVTPHVVAARMPPKLPLRRARLPLVFSSKKEELTAVSYPAPPMPLTEQEKLLVRLAHKGDPVQLAMLDPVQREASYTEERAQVQKFFTPPKQEIPSEP